MTKLYKYQQEAVQKIDQFGGRALLADKNKFQKIPKISLDFSLCPYYNGVWKINIDNKRDYSNAKRNLSENRKSVESSQIQSCQRKRTRSKNQSGADVKENCKESRMAAQSIFSDQTSYALSKGTKKTFERIGECQKKTRNQLQRGKRSGTDRDCQISRQGIISMWLSKGISNPNKTCQEYVQKCTRCLQSRFCKSRGKSSNRVGRSVPSFSGSTKEGFEKNQSVDYPWVDCNTLVSLHSIMFIPNLQTGLYKYQLEDVLSIDRLNGRVLLASEMGIGKTIEALCYLQLNPTRQPIIVVCPASLKWVWQTQAHQHVNMRSEVLNGTKPPGGQITNRCPLLIINYEILQYWLPYLRLLCPKVLIIDECHYIKTYRTKRTKAVRALAKSIPHVIAISGTPLTNRPSELWTTLNMLYPQIYPSFFSFAFRYCKPKKLPWGWVYKGAANLGELHRNLKDTMMIRRLKRDVLKELPDKARYVVPLEAENMHEYQRAVTDFITWLSRQSPAKARRARKAEKLVQMGYLKRLAAQLKTKPVLEWIDNFLEESDSKLVLYCIHKNIIDTLYNKYRKISAVVDGSITGRRRMMAVHTFQNDKRIRLFIGNIRAAGVGFTLTAADTLAFVELDFVPGNHTQAEDRIHRIGQKNVASIYYLIAKDTIEENLCQLIQRKQKVLDATLDGGRVADEFDVFDKLEAIIREKEV